MYIQGVLIVQQTEIEEMTNYKESHFSKMFPLRKIIFAVEIMEIFYN